jgi:hypothetical protein
MPHGPAGHCHHLPPNQDRQTRHLLLQDGRTSRLRCTLRSGGLQALHLSSLLNPSRPAPNLSPNINAARRSLRGTGRRCWARWPQSRPGPLSRNPLSAAGSGSRPYHSSPPSASQTLRSQQPCRCAPSPASGRPTAPAVDRQTSSGTPRSAPRGNYGVWPDTKEPSTSSDRPLPPPLVLESDSNPLATRPAGATTSR